MAEVESAFQTLMSIKDYLTDEDLEDRLKCDMLKHLSPQHDREADKGSYIPAWMLPYYDPETEQQNTVHNEFHRLKTLKSYSVAGQPADDDFRRLTFMARRIFNTPISTISTMDLDKCWCFATTIDGITECPRNITICTHTIMAKGETLVVPDASKDFRFANLAPIAGPPFVRFYAAAPLIVNEGVRIGTLCVMGMEPRPEGLTQEEKDTLVDLAATVVRMLVDRRNRLNSITTQKDLVASFSHEIMTPLTGLQLSLSILNDDADLHRTMTLQQRELVDTSVSCCDLMVNLYQAVAQTMRDGIATEASSLSRGDDKSAGQLSDVVTFLKQVMRAIPTEVPILFDVDKSMEHQSISNELIVFRAALTFISTACSRTKTSFVRHRIYGKGERIVFEFEDTAPAIGTEDRNIFLDRNACCDEFVDPTLTPLRYATSLLKSIQAKYGLQQNDEFSGSVFWFSISANSQQDTKSIVGAEIPLIIPSAIENKSTSSMNSQVNDNIERLCTPSPDSDLVASVDPVKTALIIDDSLVVRKGIGRMLSLAQYRVSTAENGLEGLNRMMQERFDIVLCDFLMPVMDGFDCVRQFRFWERPNRPLTKRQLIVGISAHASGDDSQKGLEAGMDHFHSKPITSAILKQLDLLVYNQDHKMVTEHPIKDMKIDKPMTRHAIVDGVLVTNESNERALLRENCKLLDAADTTSGRLANVPLLHLKGSEISPSLLQTGDTPMCASSLENEGTKRESQDFRIVKANAKKSKTLPIRPELHVLGIRRCLLATTHITRYTARQEVLNKKGWGCEVTTDGDELSRKLRLINWDMVVIDASLGFLSPAVCMRDFREWERKHRIGRQSNVFLDCSNSGLPDESDGSFARFIQPPFGFDGVLSTAADWDYVDRTTIKSYGGTTGLSSAHMITR